MPRWFAVSIALLGSVAVRGTAQRALLPPTPVAAVDGVLTALQDHPVVCLGEGTHRGVQDFELRLGILKDAGAGTLVDDIVVEFGNSRYQDLMDRFVRGDEVPDEQLRHVWEDAVPADTVPDSPVYEQLYRAVRSLNATRQPQKQLRVLLGDPPIDWSAVRSTADLAAWDSRRDRHAAELIRREVLEKGRRALVLYGSWHCAARNDKTNFTTADSLRALLDQSDPGAVFAIQVFGREDADPGVVEPAIASWATPAFAGLSGTTLGAVDVSAINALDSRFEREGDVRRRLTRDEWRRRTLGEQFDAVVYLGPPSSLTVARIDAQRCRDVTYLDMRMRRMALALDIRLDTSTADDPIGQLRQYCATQARP